MPQLGNFVRGGGVMATRAGRGESTIVALRVEHLPENPQRLADANVAQDGIAAVQIGATDLAGTSVPTVGMLKDEGIFAGRLIIAALDEGSLRGALRWCQTGSVAFVSPNSIKACSRLVPVLGILNDAVVLACRADRPRARAAGADRRRRSLRL